MKNLIKGKVAKKVELFPGKKWISVIKCDDRNFEEMVIINDSWNEEGCWCDISMKVGKVILDSSYVEESDGDGDDEDDQIDPTGEEDDADENGENFQLWFEC